jgi:alpha-ketoglutarate-dependent taurine dioxygenase
MPLMTKTLTPRIGTELLSDLPALLSGDHAREIRDLLEQRGVLIVRDLFMNKQDQIAFARTLGKVQAQGEGGVFKISIDPKENPVADYIKGSFFWHIDGASDDVPNFAALLNARVLSEQGGDTHFANTYTAYEDLSEEEKRRFADLRVVHSFETSQRYVNPEPASALLAEWQRYTPKVHPLVWTHRSGRKSLVLGSTADRIEGMDLAEGRLLLAELRERATRPDNVYVHKWQPGDLLIWDNTGTMHRVDPYPVDSGRLMHRTTIDGEEAIA